MKFKIFSAPGDHRDDFVEIERQLNQWASTELADVLHIQMDVHELAETKTTGRYLMTVLVGYQPAAG